MCDDGLKIFLLPYLVKKNSKIWLSSMNSRSNSENIYSIPTLRSLHQSLSSCTIHNIVSNINGGVYGRGNIVQDEARSFLLSSYLDPTPSPAQLTQQQYPLPLPPSVTFFSL